MGASLGTEEVDENLPAAAAAAAATQPQQAPAVAPPVVARVPKIVLWSPAGSQVRSLAPSAGFPRPPPGCVTVTQTRTS